MERETRLVSGVRPIEIYRVSAIPEAGMDLILDLFLKYFKIQVWYDTSVGVDQSLHAAFDARAVYAGLTMDF